MKIGYIYYRFPMFSGTSSYYKEFLDSILLGDKSTSIVLISFKYPINAKVKVTKRFNIIWLKWLNLPFINNFYFEIAVFLKGILSKDFRSVDIIHVSNIRGLLAAKLLSFLLKKPLVISLEILNDPMNGIVNRLVYIFQRFFFTFIKSEVLICWSRYYYNILISDWHMNQDKIQIIPPGIDTNIFNSNVSGNIVFDRYANGKILIVFAKPLYPGNYPSALLLLKSVARSKYKNKIMILYGNGEHKNDLDIEIERYKMKNNATFMPFNVPFEKIPNYLAAANLIVLSFTYPPTIARSFLEALSIGKPLIVTNIGEIPFIVKHKETALLSDPNPTAIARNIDLLIENKSLSLKLSRNAENLVNEKFSLKATSSLVIKVYKELL